MSKKIGPNSFKADSDQPFLGRDYNRVQHTSEKTAELIDEEVRHLIEEAERRGREILEENRDLVETMAEKLLEVETIHDWQIKQIVDREEFTTVNPAVKDEQSLPDNEPREQEKRFVPPVDSKGLGNALPEPT